MLNSKRKTSVTQQDYRRTNDGVMVADIGFKKQLWALDPELDLAWDAFGNKWEIWKFPGQAKKPLKVMGPDAMHVASIQTKDRSFREVGADVLLKLQAGDTRKFSIQEIADYLDKMDDNLERAKRKAFMDEMDDIQRSADRWWWTPKRQVPFQYRIKPSEDRLVIKTPMKKAGHFNIEIPKSKKIARAIGG